MKFFNFIFAFILVGYFLKTSAQTGTEILFLKQEVNEIKNEISAQKTLNSKILEKLDLLIENQNKSQDSTNTLINTLNILSNSLPNSDNSKFQNAFLLDKLGLPFAYIDNEQKIYSYSSGNLLGQINTMTNEVIRNFDSSIVAILDGDFLIDDTGHPIASIERSENLRWEREKLYSKTQKTPISHYFVMNIAPQIFIPNSFRFSSWSDKKLSEVLYFDETKVQKSN